MYVPRPFEATTREQLIEHTQVNGFAMLVTHDAERGLQATHIPVVAAIRNGADADSVGLILRGHVARANPQGAQLASQPESEVLVVFPGPHAYISPTAYDSPNSVPTWDYTAVHAYGYPRVVHDSATLLSTIGELTARYEPSYQSRWDGMPEDYRDGMLAGIVGFEIIVTRIESSFKLSQNKSHDERRRIVAWLRASATGDNHAVAELIERTL